MRIDCAYFFEAMLHDLPMLRNQPYAAQMFVKRSARPHTWDSTTS